MVDALLSVEKMLASQCLGGVTVANGRNPERLSKMVRNNAGSNPALSANHPTKQNEMDKIEIGILLLLFAIFWLVMAAPAIADIYWLRSENKRIEKERKKDETR